MVWLLPHVFSVWSVALDKEPALRPWRKRAVKEFGCI